MRFGFFLLVLTILIGGLFVLKPDSLPFDIGEYFDSMNYERDVRIVGLDLLKPETVRHLLPKGKSNIWWNNNRQLIAMDLMQHRLIAQATIENCKDRSLAQKFSCFDIKIRERQPKYIALMEKGAWVLGEDGAFIVPLTDKRVAEFEQNKTDLKMIKGLKLDAARSPDLMRARFNYVRELIERVEGETGHHIDWLDLSSNGEVHFKFVDLNPEVVLPYMEDSHLGPIELTDRLIKLKLILQDLAGRENQTQKIDLGFDRMAVVKSEIK